VVENSTYSDSGFILELYVDKDVEGVPLCIPSSLIAEGEIQFGDNCHMVFHSFRVENGNVRVVATLERDTPLTQEELAKIKRFDIAEPVPEGDRIVAETKIARTKVLKPDAFRRISEERAAHAAEAELSPLAGQHDGSALGGVSVGDAAPAGQVPDGAVPVVSVVDPDAPVV
jgi:hypothetical protein